MSTHTSVVIGGGFAGIAAAVELSDRGDRVHLIERDSRLGGKVDEVVVGDLTVPKAADNYLARRPEVSGLAERLGLADELIVPAASSPRIYRDGALHRLPPNVLGIPATDELAATGLISAAGAERAALDRTMPDDRPSHDESVGALVRRRLGDEVLEYLVDPLLGGINAGDSDQLSLESGTPQLAELRTHGPSLLDAAAAALAKRPANPAPVFRSVRGGLCRLVDAAEAELRSRANVSIHVDYEATLSRDQEGWAVDGIDADHVVIATPALAASKLLDTIAPDVSTGLTAIDYSSPAVAIIVLAPNTLDVDPAISGILVPRLCGLHITAISFASHKWPDIAGDGRQILRISTGRRNDTRWMNMSDEDLMNVVLADASEVLGQIVPPGKSAIARWPHSLPQYDVGHADWVAGVDSQLSRYPGLSFAGAWRNGLGLPAVVASGQSV